MDKPAAPSRDPKLGSHTPAYFVWAYENLSDPEFEKVYKRPKAAMKQQLADAEASLGKKVKPSPTPEVATTKQPESGTEEEAGEEEAGEPDPEPEAAPIARKKAAKSK